MVLHPRSGFSTIRWLLHCVLVFRGCRSSGALAFGSYVSYGKRESIWSFTKRISSLSLSPGRHANLNRNEGRRPSRSEYIKEIVVACTSRQIQQEGTKNEEDLTASYQISATELSFESAFAALHAYHNIHGDLVLPRRFVVPVDPTYPQQWHQMDLASVVYSMNWWKLHIKNRPERVSRLSKLGFIWERLQPEWNLILEALVTFRAIHNNVLVPYRFVVPRGDSQWPRATWGLPLGSCVYRIRARNDFLRGHHAGSRRDQLDGLGFVWDIQEHRFRKFYTVLRHYAQRELSGPYSKNGEKKIIRVPSNYIVPQCKGWPEDLWGYPLGVKSSAVRKGLYIKHEPRFQIMLAELGFRPTGNADLGWLRVVHASAIYSRRNGRTLDVPLSFIVPEKPSNMSQDDWPWPQYLCGLPLGQRLKDIRVKQAYLKGKSGDNRRQQLNALGMNWTPKKGRRTQIK
jgi:Arc/MetJ-type ribon-helix-helix transcriptional regulator